MDVKDLIRTKRIEMGYSMKELARLVGVSEATVSRWESGEIANMRRATISSLATVLRIPPEKLLGMDIADGYYTDPETAAYAEELRTNPEMKMLFSAAKDISKESMKKTYEYIKFLKTQEKGNDES